MTKKLTHRNDVHDVKCGLCAKRPVACILIDRKGNRIEGTNWCVNPQKVCPRQEGDDYSKCSTICEQNSHAEIDALRRAAMTRNFNIEGSIAILVGHDYFCQDCQIKLFDAGVASLRRMKTCDAKQK